MCEAVQVEDLALMIRATRGRSSRPNHMPSLLNALQTLPPLISDDLRASSIALRNELRFTSLLGPIFKDFGRFWEANLEGKIDF